LNARTTREQYNLCCWSTVSLSSMPDYRKDHKNLEFRTVNFFPLRKIICTRNVKLFVSNGKPQIIELCLHLIISCSLKFISNMSMRRYDSFWKRVFFVLSLEWYASIYSKIDICMELDLSTSLFATVGKFRDKYFDE